MFSMPVPAHLLAQLPDSLRLVDSENLKKTGFSPLSVGQSGVDALLPDGGILRGAVTELAVRGGAALGTSLALGACREAQQEAKRRGAHSSWCAFVDPTGSLYGPAIHQAGIELERLLVVRPSLEALERVAIRLAESRAFTVLVIDLVGVPGGRASDRDGAFHVSLNAWPRVIRRVAMALEGTETSVLLITDSQARRSLPLPVATRLELNRRADGRLGVQVAKDKRGRVGPMRAAIWNDYERLSALGNAPCKINDGFASNRSVQQSVAVNS